MWSRWIAKLAASLLVTSRVLHRELCMGICSPKRSRGLKSRGDRRGEIAKKLRELGGDMKRQYALVGSRRLPFYDGTTSSGDAAADPDRDGRHEEACAVEHESETAASEPHGASSIHGDAERDGLAEVGGMLDERDGSRGRDSSNSLLA